MSEPPTPGGDLFNEETDDPLVADRRNFFKVELWTQEHSMQRSAPTTGD